MDKLFFSKDNFNLLNKILGNKIRDEHDINIENKYNKNLVDTMKYVYSKINPIPPSNLSSIEYLDLMNIKTLSIITPNIKKEIEKSRTLNRLQPKIVETEPIQSIIPSKIILPPQNIMQNKMEESLRQQRLPSKDKNNVLQKDTNEMYSLQSNEIKDSPLSIDDSEKEYKRKLEERGLLNNNVKNDEENNVENIGKIKEIKNEENNNKKDIKDKEYFTNFPKEDDIIFNPIIENSDFYDIDNDINESTLPTSKKKNINVNNQATIQNKLDENNLSYNSQNINNTSNVILQKKSKYTTKKYFIVIDSRDRNLDLYPKSTHFMVKFSPATDDKIIKPICVTIGNNTIIYVIKEDIIGDSHHANIPITFENIVSIKCTQAIIPLDSVYICGIAPNKYYPNSVDTICNYPGTFPVKNYSRTAIWNNYIGIETTILDEPYLLLNVKELESYSPYSASTNTGLRNAMTRLCYDTSYGQLSPFIKMFASDVDEYYVHSPTTLGKLNTFTISLRTPTNTLVDLGQDKIYVKKFEESPLYINNCKSTNKSKQVRVYLSNDKNFCAFSPECGCGDSIYSHGCRPGDLLYFYNTQPCNPIFVVFQNETYTITYNNFTINPIAETTSGNYIININITTETFDVVPIDFSKFLQVDDFIVLKYGGKDNFYKVISFIDNYHIIIETNNPNFIVELSPIIKVGYAKNDRRGYQNNDKYDLIYRGGVRVCEVGDINNSGNIIGPNFCSEYDPNVFDSQGTPFLLDEQVYFFDINLPWDTFPSCYKDPYYKNNIFFIKQKLQVSYTFKIEIMEKNSDYLDSYIN